MVRFSRLMISSILHISGADVKHDSYGISGDIVGVNLFALCIILGKNRVHGITVSVLRRGGTRGHENMPRHWVSRYETRCRGNIRCEGGLQGRLQVLDTTRSWRLGACVQLGACDIHV